MPSARHQSLVRLLTEARGALAAALSLVDIHLPDDLQLRPGPDAVRDGGPSDLFPDGTMVAYRTRDTAHEGFVVEVQLLEDAHKLFTWLVYLALVRHRLRCPTTLVVVTDSDAVARWAAGPIALGRDFVLSPVVIGPEQIPHELSPEVLQKVPALATLAVVAHGRGPHAEYVGRVALETIQTMIADGDDHAGYHADVVFNFLDEHVRRTLWETMMGTHPKGAPYNSFLRKLWDEYQAMARAEGEARMLERLMIGRGLHPSDEQRDRMKACSDHALLEHWFDRALTATSTEEIFES